MKYCPNCSAVHDDEDNFCRDCGHGFSAEKKRAYAPYLATPKKHKVNIPGLIVLAVVVISTIWFINDVIAFETASSSPEAAEAAAANTAANTERTRALIFSREMVEETLSYPKTAKFGANDYEFGREGKYIHVKGSVTSENAFGVPSEMEYLASLILNESDFNSYTPIYLWVGGTEFYDFSEDIDSNGRISDKAVAELQDAAAQQEVEIQQNSSSSAQKTTPAAPSPADSDDETEDEAEYEDIIPRDEGSNRYENYSYTDESGRYQYYSYTEDIDYYEDPESPYRDLEIALAQRGYLQP